MEITDFFQELPLDEESCSQVLEFLEWNHVDVLQTKDEGIELNEEPFDMSEISEMEGLQLDDPVRLY